MQTIINRMRIYTKNAGFRGFLSIAIFFFLFWFGIDAFIKSGELMIFFYFAGIIISVAAAGKLTDNPQKFTMALRIFVLLAVTAGFIKSIPAVEIIANQYSSVITGVLFLLLGFFLTGSFIVYSDPENIG